MKKILLGVGVALALILAALVIGRNILVKAVISKTIEALAGVKVEIGHVNIGLTRPVFQIASLKIHNPSGFNDELMLHVPEVYVEYDLGSFLSKSVRFKRINIIIDDFLIALNSQGQLNLKSLALLMPPAGGEPMDVKIDQLSLKIIRVRSAGALPILGKAEQAWTLNLDESFSDVTEPQKIALAVVQKVLSSVGLGRLGELNFKAAADQWKKSAQDALRQGKDDLQKTAESARSTLRETSKNLLKDVQGFLPQK